LFRVLELVSWKHTTTKLPGAPIGIASAALEESVHVVGLSILSGSHVPLVHDIMERMRAAGLGGIPVVVGGIIPAEDEATLKECGVAAIHTPKNFQLNQIMAGIVQLADPEAGAAAL
jgi:(2R)-ethylmalonyl-CoA mutase